MLCLLCLYDGMHGPEMWIRDRANGGPGGPATVWGMDEKMAAVNAALVLGTISDALDWEDCSWTGHPAAGVIPCAWLAAEEKHKSGKELITAIVAGYEVYQRIDVYKRQAPGGGWTGARKWWAPSAH